MAVHFLQKLLSASAFSNSPVIESALSDYSTFARLYDLPIVFEFTWGIFVRLAVSESGGSRYPLIIRMGAYNFNSQLRAYAKIRLALRKCHPSVAELCLKPQTVHPMAKLGDKYIPNPPTCRTTTAPCCFGFISHCWSSDLT